MQPLILDLFCKAGGAGMGYHQAGFDVVGVDIEPQLRYPFPFICMDALECLCVLIEGRAITDNTGRAYFLHDFAAIHASPPCQVHSALAHLATPGKHKDLIPETRELLGLTDLPYVIENVVGAPLLSPVQLCGTMFDLRTKCGAELRRHRLFETNWLLMCGLRCLHSDIARTVSVHGGKARDVRMEKARYRTITVTGSKPQQNVVRNEIRETFPVSAAREAMGIPWMVMAELSQAIPPAYTLFIGEQLLRYIY